MSAKKRVLPALAAALLLSACGTVKSPNGSEAGGRILPDAGGLTAFSGEETESMANFMGANRALILNGALYTLDLDDSFRPVLARYALEGDGDLGARTVLAEDCLPEYLTAAEGELYYVNRGQIESLTLSGGERRILRPGSCDFLRLYAGELWFCDEEGRLCRMSPEGGEAQTVLEEACFYPWVRDGALLWQGGEEEDLFLTRLEDGAPAPLAAGPCYAPVGLDGRLYATGREALLSMALDGSDRQEQPLPGLQGPVELIPEGGGFVLRWVVEDNGLRQFTAEPESPEAAQEASRSGYRRCDLAGESWRVDAWYQEDGRLRCFLLVSPQGTETAYLNGVIETEAGR